MICRMCGFEFDENCASCGGCQGCGSHDCSNTVHCPNCGYGNSLAYEQEFEFIKKIKEKIKSLSK